MIDIRGEVTMLIDRWRHTMLSVPAEAILNIYESALQGG